MRQSRRNSSILHSQEGFVFALLPLILGGVALAVLFSVQKIQMGQFKEMAREQTHREVKGFADKLLFALNSVETCKRAFGGKPIVFNTNGVGQAATSHIFWPNSANTSLQGNLFLRVQSNGVDAQGHSGYWPTSMELRLTQRVYNRGFFGTIRVELKRSEEGRVYGVTVPAYIVTSNSLATVTDCRSTALGEGVLTVEDSLCELYKGPGLAYDPTEHKCIPMNLTALKKLRLQKSELPGFLVTTASHGSQQ